MTLFEAFEDYCSKALKTEANAEVILRKLTGYSARTIPNVAIEKLRFLHGVIGLCTEVGELVAGTNYIEEAGDAFWYVAIIHSVCGPPYSIVLDPTIGKNSQQYEKYAAARNLSTQQKLVIQSSELLDAGKKWLFYDRSFERAAVCYRLGHVVDLLAGFAGNTSLVEIWRRNNDKLLKVRYPAGFTEEKANNRDLASEAVAIGEDDGA